MDMKQLPRWMMTTVALTFAALLKGVHASPGEAMDSTNCWPYNVLS